MLIWHFEPLYYRPSKGPKVCWRGRYERQCYSFSFDWPQRVGATAVFRVGPYESNPEGAVSREVRISVQTRVVIDSALQAEPIALVVNQVSAALEAGSQSEDFHV